MALLVTVFQYIANGAIGANENIGGNGENGNNGANGNNCANANLNPNSNHCHHWANVTIVIIDASSQLAPLPFNSNPDRDITIKWCHGHHLKGTNGDCHRRQ